MKPRKLSEYSILEFSRLAPNASWLLSCVFEACNEVLDRVDDGWREKVREECMDAFLVMTEGDSTSVIVSRPEMGEPLTPEAERRLLLFHAYSTAIESTLDGSEEASD